MKNSTLLVKPLFTRDSGTENEKGERSAEVIGFPHHFINRIWWMFPARKSEKHAAFAVGHNRTRSNDRFSICRASSGVYSVSAKNPDKSSAGKDRARPGRSRPTAHVM
jgi:hypothetical protein